MPYEEEQRGYAWWRESDKNVKYIFKPYWSGFGQDAPPTFTDPTVLQQKEREKRNKLRGKRNRTRQGPVFTDQGAVDTYKGLRKAAAEQIICLGCKLQRV